MGGWSGTDDATQKRWVDRELATGGGRCSPGPFGVADVPVPLSRVLVLPSLESGGGRCSPGPFGVAYVPAPLTQEVLPSLALRPKPTVAHPSAPWRSVAASTSAR